MVAHGTVQGSKTKKTKKKPILDLGEKEESSWLAGCKKALLHLTFVVWSLPKKEKRAHRLKGSEKERTKFPFTYLQPATV